MNFVKYSPLFAGISALVIIPGIISLALWGLKPSIDFTGGSLLEVAVPETAESQAVQAAAAEKTEVTAFIATTDGHFILKMPELTTEKKNEVVDAITTAVGPVEVRRFESIGPTLSKELLTKTLTAIGLVATFIIIYVARQFSELKYGVAAIIAMLHDSLVLLGVFSLLGHFMGVEVDVLFVTAVLTTLSFSVHDTIVVFHRIRELRNRNRTASLESILNSAVLTSSTRSINNSVTIILMLFALALLGGETIRWFAVALLVGAVTGTYSSPCVAIPVLYTWEKITNRKK